MKMLLRFVAALLLISGLSALLYAANNDHIEVVKVLIASGANLHDKEISGRTAYHMRQVRAILRL